MVMKNVYTLVFDGFADWEPVLALCELKRREDLKVITVGFSMDPIVSLAGYRIIPDIGLTEVTTDDAALLMLPGGEIWMGDDYNDVITLAREFADAGVSVAAACAATIVPGKAGLYTDRLHTSNSFDFLSSYLEEYDGSRNYRDEKAVRDNGLVTAGGADYVEFSLEVLKELGGYDEDYLRGWYRLVKEGIVPEDY